MSVNADLSHESLAQGKENTSSQNTNHMAMDSIVKVVAYLDILLNTLRSKRFSQFSDSVVCNVLLVDV